MEIQTVSSSMFVARKVITNKFGNWSSLSLQKLAWYIVDQGPDFNDIPSFFPFEIDIAIEYINLRYGAQAPKIVNL